jgi:hypothetical protein
MRVTVRDQRHQFNPQTHAYAEYRAFSGLIGYDSPLDVTVSLTRGPARGREDGRVVCTIAVTLASGETAEVRAVARHPHAAIDKAVSLLQERSPRPSGRPDPLQTAAAERENA